LSFFFFEKRKKINIKGGEIFFGFDSLNKDPGII